MRSDLEPFAKLVRLGLACRRMSGAELARALGITTSATQRWTAASSAPDSETVRRAEALLELPPGLLEHALAEPAEAYDPLDSRWVALWMEDVEADTVGYATRAADPDAVETPPDGASTPIPAAAPSATTTLPLPAEGGAVRDVTVAELVRCWLERHPITSHEPEPTDADT